MRNLVLSPELLSYEEDVESSVSVVEEMGAGEGARTLMVNHAMVAQTTRMDRPGHEMIAHVPLLLHPDPKDVLLIGFGIGFTTRTCLVHDCNVDVVELSPGVRKANVLFAPLNGDVLRDERVNLRIEDGRNYVLGTERRYDMVQAGIIHPAVSSGNAWRKCSQLRIWIFQPD